MRDVPGRAEDLAAIGRAWSRLAAPRCAGEVCPPSPHGPVVVLVTGDPGVGKSHLVGEAAAGLDPPPAVTLTGRARAHAPAPYDWLASAVDDLPPSEDAPSGVPPEVLAWLTQRPDPAARRLTPGQLLRAAVRTVRARVADGPGLLVVEDLHELDPASLELVAELAQLRTLPALMLVTSRPPDEAAAPALVGRVLGRLAGHPDAVRRHLRPLTPAQTADLVAARGGTVVPERVRALHRRTAGNPRWLVELLTATEEFDGDPLRDGPPRHVVGLVAGWLAEDPPAVAAVARAAALLGDGVAVRSLARVCGADKEPVMEPARDGEVVGEGPVPPGLVAVHGGETGDQVESAVGRLHRRGLVRLDRGGRLRFRQPLVAEAVRATAAPEERVEVYRAALGATDDPVAVLRAATALDRPELAGPVAAPAVRALLRAGLPAAAVTAARDVLSGRASADGSPAWLPDLLRDAVLAAQAAGMPRDAVELAERAVTVGGAAHRAAAHRELAALFRRLGRTDDAVRRHDAAAAGLADRDDPAGWAWHLESVATERLRAGRVDDAVRTASEALTVARLGGDLHAENAALLTLGVAVARSGEPDRALTLLRAARRLAETHYHPVLLSRCAAALIEVQARYRGDAAGWRAFEDAVTDLNRRGIDHGLGGIVAAGAALAVRLGDADRARRLVADRLPVETDVTARAALAACLESPVCLESPDDASLTGRETEVLACLAAGLTNRQTATRLGISARTVAVHVSNVLRKTASASRTEAAMWAVRHGLRPAAGRLSPTPSTGPRSS